MKASTIVNIARGASYNEEVKAKYKKLAMAWLRLLALRLCLNEKEFDLRFNAGGIAVSGEATLHHEKFYIQFSETGVMWRECKGRKDYSGGTNRWFVGFGGHGNTEQLEHELAEILKVSA